MQGRGLGIWPLLSIPSLDEGPLEAKASIPQVELTRDVLEFNDDQLWEALEALQTKTAQRGRAATPLGLPQGNPRVPEGSSEAVTEDGEVDPRRERGWRYGEPMPQPIRAPQLTSDVGLPLSMLTARLRMDTPHINTFSGDATPRKTKVSFGQWYHKVQCIKDHFPEEVVWESIIQSLKGAIVDMARHMGPTTSIDHILCKLSVIFGTVASFDVLMQNFYKMSQGNNEKVSSFALRLGGSSTKFSYSALGAYQT